MAGEWRDSRLGKAKSTALRRWILTLLTAAALALVLVPSAVAGASPLGGAAATVEEVVKTATAPILPSTPPAPAPVPVAPAQTPSAPVRVPSLPIPQAPSSVHVPIPTPPTNPAGSPSIAVPSGPSTARAIETDTDEPASAVTRTAEFMAGAGEATSTTGEAPDRVAAGTEGSDRRSGAPRPTVAAPISRLLAFVWPAVALVGPAPVAFLLERGRAIASSIKGGETGSTSSTESAASGGSENPHGGGGAAEWIGGRFPDVADLFDPDSPLPLLALYLILAIGIGGIWHLGRKEVGLRTFSRHRRL